MSTAAKSARSTAWLRHPGLLPWSLAVPLLVLLVLGSSGRRPLGLVLDAAMSAALSAAMLAAVHHAEVHCAPGRRAL